MEQTPLQEDSNMMTFKGVIGRKQYYINFGLLLLGFIATGLIFVYGLYLDQNLLPEERPSQTSSFLYMLAVSGAIPLLYMSWINKFKRIRDIRGTREKEKLWFGLWILLGLIPYSGIILTILLGMPKGKVTNSKDK